MFCEGDGLDTPAGHPTLDSLTEDQQNTGYVDPFGFERFPSAQDVSDLVFNINNTDTGNNGKVPHLFMTFGQFMDHDFAYILHPSSTSTGCRSRYQLPEAPVRRCSSKQVFLKTLQYSQENTCVGISF